MIVRRVHPVEDRDDRAVLRSFPCSDGTPAQDRVEAWIRQKLDGWLNASVANELWVLDDEGEIAGLFTLEPGEEENETFIAVLAVRTDYQSREGGQHAHVGSGLLETALEIIAARNLNPGRAGPGVGDDGSQSVVPAGTAAA